MLTLGNTHAVVANADWYGCPNWVRFEFFLLPYPILTVGVYRAPPLTRGGKE